jgi:hypothetical protein
MPRAKKPAGPKNSTTSRGGSRLYTWGEDKFPSVTTIISAGIPKPALQAWAVKVVAEGALDMLDELKAMMRKGHEDAALKMLKGLPYNQRDSAANMGSLVHAAAEAHVKGESVKSIIEASGEDAVPYLHAFSGFLRDYKPEYLALEATVYNRTDGYAGTADAFMEVDGKSLVVDLKTNRSGPWTEVGLQLSAYARGEFIGDDGKEAPVPQVVGGAVLWLQPYEYEFREVLITDPVYEAFLAAKVIHDWTNGAAGAPPLSKQVIDKLLWHVRYEEEAA